MNPTATQAKEVTTTFTPNLPKHLKGNLDKEYQHGSYLTPDGWTVVRYGSNVWRSTVATLQESGIDTEHLINRHIGWRTTEPFEVHAIPGDLHNAFNAYLQGRYRSK